MKKWGFWLVLLCSLFCNNVYAYNYNKVFTNPYQLGSYQITNTTNNVVWNSSNTDDTMRVLNFNDTVSYNLKVDIDFMSNASESYLDIGDATFFEQNETDLKYWVVPMCVNKYDFSVSMNSGNCPACFNKNNNVAILFGSDNSCSLVEPSFVGPTKYLHDPEKGTVAIMVFQVKQYRVPNTLLTATANDRFTIYNNRSDYELVYRFLDDINYIGGLYDENGIKELGLRYNPSDIAEIQNDNVNSPYKCELSYNRLNTSQGTYFNDNTLTMSTSTLSLIRNLNDKNYFIPISGSTSENGLTLTKNNDGSYTVNGTASANTNFILNAFHNTLSAGTYIFSDGVNGESNSTYFMYLDPIDVNSYSHRAFTINSTTDLQVRIVIRQGQTLNNITFFPQIEKGNKISSYVPYYIYGFNNNIDKYNYTSLNFVETNLVEKGKVQYCVKYLDDWTNETNVVCNDFIIGSESSFLGMTSHMHYMVQASVYNTCLYGFGYLCGSKMPQSIQFQLIDTNNSYYFTKPLLYSRNVSYNKTFGTVDMGETNLPSYVAPGLTVCTDKNNGNKFDYNTREEIYSPTNKDDTYADDVYLQQSYDSLLGNYELPENFGLSGLIEIPIDFIGQVRSGVCTPINLSFNIKNQNVDALTLPCGSTFWNREDIQSFKPFLSTFFTGMLVYQIIYRLFFWVRSKRDPVKITHDDGTEELMFL